MKKLTIAINMAIYGMALSPALVYAEQANELAPINVESGKISTASEGTGSYNVAKTSNSTGLSISAKETPQSVSVLTHQQMRDQGANSIDKALQNVHGVSVRAFDRGRNTFSARGFDIERYQVDGLPVEQHGAWVTGETTSDMVLFDRVEVVRGANGLTTGAGNPSASINLIRKTASNPNRATILEAGIGTYGNWTGMIDHNQPLNADGSIRARFIANYQGDKTFVDRERIGKNTFYADFEADLSDNTTINLGISHQRIKQKESMWGGLPAFYDDGAETDWAVDKNASADWVYWNTNSTNYFADLRHSFNQDWKISLKTNYRTSHANSALLYYSGSSVNRADGLGWTPWPGKFHVDNRQISLALQLEGKFQAWSQTHDLSFGLQHSHTKRKASAAEFVAAPVSNFFTWDGSYPEPVWGATSEKYNQRIIESGFYASTRLRLTDNLSAILGSRFSKYESKGVSYGSSLDYKTQTVWTPYAGLVLDLNEYNSLYVSYTDIFKPQTERDSKGKILEPIRGQSYEMGWKGSFFEDNLQTQVSLFKTVQDNLAQASGFVEGTSPPEVAYTPAKGATVKGFELEATGNLSDEVKISAGYTQWTGKDQKHQAINTKHPRKQFKLSASYDANKWLNGLTLGGSVRWQSETYQMASDKKIAQGNYTLVDLMARYQFNDKLSAQLNINNLFNKKYRDQLGFGQYNYGEPRNANLSLRYEF